MIIRLTNKQGIMAFKMRGNPFKQSKRLLAMTMKKCPHCEKKFGETNDGTRVISDGGMAAHIASEHSDVKKKEDKV